MRPIKPSRLRLGAVLALTVLGLGGVLLSGLFKTGLPALGAALWIANLLGWCSFVLLLLLFFLPVRRRQRELPPLIVHFAHRRAGYLMLILVAGHALASIMGEPETSAYWLPTAPL